MSKNAVSTHLNGLLADTIVLNQKLHHFHWRVQGRGFFQLHAKFEELYGHFGELGDALAERILMIGGEPLATLNQARELSNVEESAAVPEAPAMVRLVRDDLRRFRDAVLAGITAAEAESDRGTANLLDPVLDSLDKEIWMLGAFLAE
ncbi:MAG TPA: DNA starvation/stationary phase protection protein [Candidatus Krumholzibacteria bacterium]|nr:DNA starvation/stationary phase protection protein [Candidatus Krumholzibacteria bacterium]